MPKKTWSQHDMNCRQKDGLSDLIDKGGPAAYGRFWILQELFMQSTYHKESGQNFFITTRHILYAELRLKHKTLIEFLSLISDTLSVRSEFIPNLSSTHSEVIPNLSSTHLENKVKIILPKSLIYTSKRFQKSGYLERELEKELERECLFLLNHLNQSTKKSFKPNKETLLQIASILRQNYTSTQIRQTIDYLAAKWNHDSKMQMYLRPSTVFGSKFEEYFEASKKEEEESQDGTSPRL